MGYGRINYARKLLHLLAGTAVPAWRSSCANSAKVNLFFARFAHRTLPLCGPATLPTTRVTNGTVQQQHFHIEETMATEHVERFVPERQKLDQLSLVKDYATVPRLEYR
jgi:hypothetical protein